jgi:hypothetical protein
MSAGGAAMSRRLSMVFRLRSGSGLNMTQELGMLIDIARVRLGGRERGDDEGGRDRGEEAHESAQPAR